MTGDIAAVLLLSLDVSSLVERGEWASSGLLIAGPRGFDIMDRFPTLGWCPSFDFWDIFRPTRGGARTGVVAWFFSAVLGAPVPLDVSSLGVAWPLIKFAK